VVGLQLDGNAPFVADRDEAGEHQHAVMRVEKPLRNEAPFAPRLLQPGGLGIHALTPPKDLFTLGIELKVGGRR
jgi:hypothetical protein